MTVVFMIGASQFLISGTRVATHLPRPFKEWLISDVKHNLMDGLIENGVDTFKAFGADGVVVVLSLAFALIELRSASACSHMVHFCPRWGCLLLGPFVIFDPRLLVYP